MNVYPPGSRSASGPAPAARPRAPLQRPRDCALGGVCAGLARHLGLRVGPVRLTMVLLAFAGGAGLLFYLWLWALVPLEQAPGPDATQPPVHRRVNVPWLLFAVATAAAVAALVDGGLGGGLGGERLLPITLVMLACAVGCVAWDELIDTSGGTSAFAGSVAQAVAGGGGASRSIRVAAGTLLVVTAVLEPFAWAHSNSWLAWPLFTATLVVAAVVLLGPWGLRLWRELMAERTVRVREEQRAEIAAHLHDSVLQTLALIQNRAGASSEVARIARAQERELRDWLYAGSAPLDSDIATELRDFAATLELEHAVRFDVVAVGEPLERGTGEVAAAAREAMLNAARHAGGDVSVYIETTRAAVDVFVRDRGPGFDPDAVPQGRLGVRESILGRMRRAGGRASVAPGAGGSGTEVHLRLERQRDETDRQRDEAGRQRDETDRQRDEAEEQQ